MYTDEERLREGKTSEEGNKYSSYGNIGAQKVGKYIFKESRKVEEAETGLKIL